MKIGKLLLTAVIALGLMACNNEEGPELPTSADATISIKVFPSSDTPGLRATGNLSGNGIAAVGLAAESAIKTLEAWVFVNGNLETYKSVTIADAAETEITNIEVTSGTRTIVVAANASIGTQATLTALNAATKALSQDISTGLPMTAEPFEVALVAGKNYYGYAQGTGGNYLSINAPKPLVRTNARVAIVDAKIELATLPSGQVHVFDALTDVEVAIFNVPGESKLFGSPLAINADFWYGASWPTTQGSYIVSTPVASLINSVTFPIVNTAAPYYYVNENTSDITTQANQRTFIVLRGKPTLGTPAVPVSAPGLYTDTNGYTYYPVWVNANDKGYTYNRPDLVGYLGNNLIQRNFQYNISLTITGIGNPTIDPAEDAWLDVKVSVAPWEVVNQNVTW